MMKNDIISPKPTELEGQVVTGFDEYLDDIVKHLESTFSFHNYISKKSLHPLLNTQKVVLIHGNSVSTSAGCGKTTLAHAVANHFQLHPFYCHVETISCVTYRGKKVDTIHEKWLNLYDNAVRCQPSIIIFDDLDELILPIDQLQDGIARNLYSDRLVDTFQSFIEMILNENKQINMLVTSTCLQSLHPYLLPEFNCHVFTKYVNLKRTADRQLDVLTSVIEHHKMNYHNIEVKLNKESLTELKKKLEGFSARDIDVVTRRAVNLKLKESSQNLAIPRGTDKETVPQGTDTETVTQDVNGCIDKEFFPQSTSEETVLTLAHFDESLQNFETSSMHGVELHKPLEISWADIGGLQSVKKDSQRNIAMACIIPRGFLVLAHFDLVVVYYCMVRQELPRLF